MATYQESHRALAALMQLISLYRVLLPDQVQRAMPHTPIKTLIERLHRQKRIFAEDGYLKAWPGLTPDPATITAFWVLLDLLATGHVDHHTRGEYPIAISLFAQAEQYDILVASQGQEGTLCQALAYSQNTDTRRILVLDSAHQLAQSPLGAVTGIHSYCTVSPDGQVAYFLKSKELSS